VSGVDEEQQPAPDAKHSASVLQTINAVFWAFFGVRRGRDYERDAARLNPLHVVIAGVLGAAVFVLTLLFIVRQVVK
jgi:hypothetical protein